MKSSGEQNYQPLIIIGAARSGTNILRNCLTNISGFSTWPCDEINYIWRHKNRECPHDQFPETLARPEVVEYLRAQFDKQAVRDQSRVLVEKTTANTLRVGFVHKVFPDAKYIFIYRHGLDSVCSAMHRWRASLDIKYLAQKAVYVPKSDIPFYGLKYLKTRIDKLFDNENSLSTWGPKPKRKLTGELNERAALQWSECVRCAQEQSAHIPDANKIDLRYEEFVQDPAKTLCVALSSLGIPFNHENVLAAVNGVHVKSVDKGKNSLDSKQMKQVKTIISTQLDRLGYI